MMTVTRSTGRASLAYCSAVQLQHEGGLGHGVLIRACGPVRRGHFEGRDYPYRIVRRRELPQVGHDAASFSVIVEPTAPGDTGERQPFPAMRRANDLA